MRISDDRYSRERLSLDLALRFLRHEARTQTIRTWTGLTDARIRKSFSTPCARCMPAVGSSIERDLTGFATYATRTPRPIKGNPEALDAILHHWVG